MDDRLLSLIDDHKDVLFRPGVLSVRPGYQSSKSWFTGKPAIVVTVAKKTSDLPADQVLPPEVGGVPVDVREASPRKALETTEPAAYASELRLSPDAGSVPHFPDEITPSGRSSAEVKSAHTLLAQKTAKPNLAYSAPSGRALTPVTAHMSLIVSASPDAGWGVLKKFLSATEETLTVGLYDFTSAHVYAEVVSALDGKKLNLVQDHPPKNPTADQTDATTIADLRTAFGTGLNQAWALTRTDADATAWIYPTSYHIKTAVQDRARVWLSSGNWNNSNQPDLHPASKAADATEARHRDRDWHVVIADEDLAGQFEDYILHDLDIASAHNGPAEAAGVPLPAPPLGSTETPEFAQFFPAKTFRGMLTITPLLTPDPGVYVDAVKKLILSAEHSLYMQFQYIELPKTVDATSQAFLDLVDAVIDRQNVAGLDLRIIMSEFETTGYLEQLIAAGLDVKNKVLIQNNVHNKGIIVDGKTVLVSSQNWSTDGVLYNRDAGVIIEHAHTAAYFQEIFLHDWEHLARAASVDD